MKTQRFPHNVAFEKFGEHSRSSHWSRLRLQQLSRIFHALKNFPRAYSCFGPRRTYGWRMNQLLSVNFKWSLVGFHRTDRIRTALSVSRILVKTTAAINETQSMSNCNNPAANSDKTLACCLPFSVSLAGNTFIEIIAFKTKTLKKPINFLIVNMAISDMFVPIFLFPRILVWLHPRTWLLDGPLGHVLCKLSVYASNMSSSVSAQSLVLIEFDWFGAVVFPFRSPLISLKKCRHFILVTWVIVITSS